LTLDTVNGRRTRGVTIAMDDFGRGHSSLSYQGTIRSTGSSLSARSSPTWRTRRTREPLSARSRNWRTASGWEQRGGIENARAAWLRETCGLHWRAGLPVRQTSTRKDVRALLASQPSQPRAAAAQTEPVADW